VEIYGEQRVQVKIDPVDVLEKLINDVIGSDSWVTKEEGNYYRLYEVSAGPHSFCKKEDITKEMYDQVIRLQKSVSYVKDNTYHFSNGKKVKTYQ
jgi:hypothetical protein